MKYGVHPLNSIRQPSGFKDVPRDNMNVPPKGSPPCVEVSYQRLDVDTSADQGTTQAGAYEAGRTRY